MNNKVLTFVLILTVFLFIGPYLGLNVFGSPEPSILESNTPSSVVKHISTDNLDPMEEVTATDEELKDQ